MNKIINTPIIKEKSIVNPSISIIERDISIFVFVDSSITIGTLYS